MIGVQTSSKPIFKEIQGPLHRESNEDLSFRVIQSIVDEGITEFCICPGARNTPFLPILQQQPRLKIYYWYEERSAAFFALGRSKLLQKPVAVITTSGTAAGELLAAAMEAYYAAIPLLLVTADRPRRYRGTGAPQSAEQKKLFGIYTPFEKDIASLESFQLTDWKHDCPAHLNICFEEPSRKWPKTPSPLNFDNQLNEKFSKGAVFEGSESFSNQGKLNTFLHAARYPFVVVSALSLSARQAVAEFLIKLNAPVFFEGVSGLREDPRLQTLRITRSDNLWENSAKCEYPIDGILRIGGIPTFRLWRDLEDKFDKIPVCSLSENPFSGLSRADVIRANLETFLSRQPLQKPYLKEASIKWLEADKVYYQKLCKLFEEEPQAEPSLVFHLSKKIPSNAQIYLGNSLPIREWDMSACTDNPHAEVFASRGVNGIDGQISTFLGMCERQRANWAILGDLTALYDMAGPWILSQLSGVQVNLVIINNGGGKIFERLFEDKAMLNEHNLNFEPFAKMWGLHYEKWTKIPVIVDSDRSRIIEIVPDEMATDRFWNKFATI